MNKSPQSDSFVLVKSFRSALELAVFLPKSIRFKHVLHSNPLLVPDKGSSWALVPGKSTGDDPTLETPADKLEPVN